MEIAKLKVDGVYAGVVMRGTVTSGLAGATIRVEYAAGIWEGLTKTVVFRGSVTKDVVTNDTTIEIPWEVLTKPNERLQVGFYGVDAAGKLIIPTVWADLGRIQPGADPSGDPSTDPSLPVWGQIASRVEEIAEDVEELKQGGGPSTPGVPGADGEDGGYYIPELSQPDEDTIQFAFTPSKADMPAVEPVTVELPAGQGSGGNVDYTAYGLPILYLTGDTSAMTKDNSVSLDYIYGELSGTSTVKWQGASSLAYPKKNYTIEFDKAFEAVEGWGTQKKYCLKANYIDFSHARNVVSAKLWGEVVKSRTNTNSKLSALPNGGAVDGFPCIVMLNGNFHGLYTFNIPKDGWLYGMNDDEATEQTEILPFKTYIAEQMPSLSTTVEYTPTSSVGPYFVTTTGNLTGGRTYVNWDTTQINRFAVMAYLFDETGVLVKVFCEKSDNVVSKYYGKSGDFNEDAWLNIPNSSRNPFYVSGPFSLPIPAGHRIMWQFLMMNAPLPEGSSLTHTYSSAAEANNTWTYKWVRTGVEFSIVSMLAPKEIIVCADTTSEATKFKTPAILSGDFDLEYASETVSEEDALSSLNRLISACINSDGTDLDSTIARYLDWDSAIDYYIFACLIGGADMGAKNYLLSTYDGTKWFFGAYDMDSTFGLWWDGKKFLPDNHYPTIEWYANYHRAMGLIWNYKRDAFKARYAELRAGALSENNVALSFSNFICKIPSIVYAEEAKKWTSIPSTSVNNLHQILNWYRMRVAVIDKEVESMT